MLTLDSLVDISITVRAMFTISLMLSMLTVFFTLVQQREMPAPSTAESLRMWLWNGKIRTSTFDSTFESATDQPKTHIAESSMTALHVLIAPYELLRISVTVFMAAVIAYFAAAWRANVNLGRGPSFGNRGLLITLVICTIFPLLMFGQALGQKDREMAKCLRVVNNHGLNNGSNTFLGMHCSEPHDAN